MTGGIGLGGDGRTSRPPEPQLLAPVLLGGYRFDRLRQQTPARREAAYTVLLYRYTTDSTAQSEGNAPTSISFGRGTQKSPFKD